MQAALVLPLVFLAFAVHSSESIKCYNCDSMRDPKCADPFMTEGNNNLLHECTPDFVKQASDVFNSAANKLNDFASSIGIGTNNKPVQANAEFNCAKIDFANGDKSWSVRQCALPGTDKTEFCKKLTELGKDQANAPKVTFCDICDKDGCNGASSMKAAILAIMVPCAALLLAQLY